MFNLDKKIKDKILEDEKFLQSLSSALIARNRNMFYDMFTVQEEECVLSNESKPLDYILDYFIKSILNKSKSNPGLVNSFIDFVIQSILSSEEGKKTLLNCFDKIEEIIIDHKKSSKQPWVNITGDIYDEDKGQLKIALDWNDEFIRLLQKKGVVGETEDEIVEQWLKGLANQ